MLQMKEQDKNLQEKLNKEEIGSLPVKELRVMIVKMIQDLRKRIKHRSRRCRKCLTKA